MALAAYEIDALIEQLRSQGEILQDEPMVFNKRSIREAERAINVFAQSFIANPKYSALKSSSENNFVFIQNIFTALKKHRLLPDGFSDDNALEGWLTHLFPDLTAAKENPFTIAKLSRCTAGYPISDSLFLPVNAAG